MRTTGIRIIVAGGAIATVLLLAPVSVVAQTIRADWDKTAAFATYKTYTMAKGQVPENANPLMVQRVESGIRSELAALGLLGVPDGGDVTIVYHAAGREDVNLQPMGYAPRWGGGNVNVDRIPGGTLVVDISDTKEKNLLWRAMATDTITDSQQKNEKKVQRAIEKMFEKYPTATKN